MGSRDLDMQDVAAQQDPSILVYTGHNRSQPRTHIEVGTYILIYIYMYIYYGILRGVILNC